MIARQVTQRFGPETARTLSRMIVGVADADLLEQRGGRRGRVLGRRRVRRSRERSGRGGRGRLTEPPSVRKPSYSSAGTARTWPEIDFTTLTQLSNEPSDQLATRFPDLLFLADRGTEGRKVVVHIEFQAGSDAVMPLRTTAYATLAAQDLLKRHSRSPQARNPHRRFHSAPPRRRPVDRADQLDPGPRARPRRVRAGRAGGRQSRRGARTENAPGTPARP